MTFISFGVRTTRRTAPNAAELLQGCYHCGRCRCGPIRVEMVTQSCWLYCCTVYSVDRYTVHCPHCRLCMDVQAYQRYFTMDNNSSSSNTVAAAACNESSATERRTGSKYAADTALKPIYSAAEVNLTFFSSPDDDDDDVIHDTATSLSSTNVNATANDSPFPTTATAAASKSRNEGVVNHHTGGERGPLLSK
jgi:hypothetical protein